LTDNRDGHVVKHADGLILDGIAD